MEPPGGTGAITVIEAGVVARLIRETREAWYELALIDARLDILTARRDALRAMSRTVEARYESGDGSQAAVWRSRAELSRLVERAADHLAKFGNYAVDTAGLMRLRTRHGIVTADKQLRLDADQMHLG